MFLDLVLLAALIGIGATAVRQFNKRIEAEIALEKELALNRTLARLNEQLRDRLDEAQHRLIEVNGMGSPGPKSERRMRRGA